MKNVLYLEKRGHDFWHDSKEIRRSDLENFRLFGYIDSGEYLLPKSRKSDKVYMVEICTHYFDKHHVKEVPANAILTNFNISFIDNKGDCYGFIKHPKDKNLTDLEVFFRSYLINKATKQDVIEYINNYFGTTYKELKIVDKLPDNRDEKETEREQARRKKTWEREQAKREEKQARYKELVRRFKDEPTNKKSGKQSYTFNKRTS